MHLFQVCLWMDAASIDSFEIIPFVMVLSINSAESVGDGARVCGSNLGVSKVRDIKMLFTFALPFNLESYPRIGWLRAGGQSLPSWVPLKTLQEVMQKCQHHDMSVWLFALLVQLLAPYHIWWWMFLWGKYVSTMQWPVLWYKRRSHWPLLLQAGLLNKMPMTWGHSWRSHKTDTNVTFASIRMMDMSWGLMFSKTLWSRL